MCLGGSMMNRGQVWTRTIETIALRAMSCKKNEKILFECLNQLQKLEYYLQQRSQKNPNSPPAHHPSHVLGSRVMTSLQMCFKASYHSCSRGDRGNDADLSCTSHDSMDHILHSGMIFDEEAGDTIFIDNSNRFSILMDDTDDDDDDDSYVSEYTQASDDDDDDDGDGDGTDERYNEDDVSIRRILIHVLTSMSELYGEVSNLQQRNKWSADGYDASFACLNKALYLIDEAYVLLFVEENGDGTGNKNSTSHKLIHSTRGMQDLAEDAKVVLLAVSSFSEKRARFWVAAEKRCNALYEKLTPLWTERDEQKARMGDKWFNNPNPKYTFYKHRKTHERELRAIERAFVLLQNMDTREAYRRSQIILDRVGAEEGRVNRRNGRRLIDTAFVSTLNTLFPDPVIYCWTFTGSDEESTTEFFQVYVPEESVTVQMDICYGTGWSPSTPPLLIKTYAIDSFQGKTKLTSKKMSVTEYLLVLKSPTTKLKNHSGQKGKNCSVGSTQEKKRTKRGSRGSGTGKKLNGKKDKNSSDSKKEEKKGIKRGRRGGGNGKKNSNDTTTGTIDRFGRGNGGGGKKKH